jgi:predicted nucleic acid-binding Zn ribbon protein
MTDDPGMMASTTKAQMKTILMLIVGLMLAGCGSTEIDVRKPGVGSTSDPASYDLGNRIAVDTICACP